MIIHLTGKDSCLDTMIASLSVNVLSSKTILKYLTMNMKFRDKLIFQTMSFTIDIMWCKISLTISVADMLNIIACSKYLESYQKKNLEWQKTWKKNLSHKVPCVSEINIFLTRWFQMYSDIRSLSLIDQRENYIDWKICVKHISVFRV